MATTTTLPADKFDTTMKFVRPDPLPTRAPLDKLAVLPGFNTRVKDDDYRERVTGIAESIAAHGFFDDKPLAVVMIEGDDTIYVFDGEHRFDGAKQASLDGAEFADGLPIAWAKDGATVKDLTIHLAHGNNGERLNMVELASVVRRMQGLDMDKDEIAAALGRTARHVDNLFVLAAANQAVKKAVATGQIAGAEAVKLLRKDKSTAAAKIAEHVAAAVARGKAKATPKTMADPKPAGPKTKTVRFEHVVGAESVMGDLLKQVAGQVREAVSFGEGDKVTEGFTISVALTVVDHEAEAAAKAKADEREAAKAARDKAAADKKAEREANAKAKADEKAAKEKQKADAKAATDAALKAEVAKKKAAAAPKKGGATQKTPEQAKADAKKHLGGDGGEAKRTPARSRAKTAPAVVTPGATEKPAEGVSGDAATSGAAAVETGAGGAAPAADGGLSDASMGGL